METSLVSMSFSIHFTLLSIPTVHKWSDLDVILITFVIHIDKKRQKASYQSYVVHVIHN